jgi:hypothetical protein
MFMDAFHNAVTGMIMPTLSGLIFAKNISGIPSIGDHLEGTCWI